MALWMVDIVIFSTPSAPFKTKILCLHGCLLRQHGWQVNAVKKEKKTKIFRALTFLNSVTQDSHTPVSVNQR